MSESKFIFNDNVFKHTVASDVPMFEINCLICHEAIPVYILESCKSTVCEKCKAAVMKMREQMEVRDE